jgi:hypothetical protein
MAGSTERIKLKERGDMTEKEEVILKQIAKYVPPGQPISNTALDQLMPYLLVQQAEIDRLREALIRAERKLSAYVGVCKGDKELTNTVLPMARAALAPHKQSAPVRVLEDRCSFCLSGNVPVLNPEINEMVHVKQGDQPDIPCWNYAEADAPDLPALDEIEKIK